MREDVSSSDGIWNGRRGARDGATAGFYTLRSPKPQSASQGGTQGIAFANS